MPPTQVDYDDLSAFSSYEALRTDIANAREFRRYLLSETTDSRQKSGIIDGFNIVTTAAQAGVLFSGVGAVGLRAIGGGSVFAQSLGRLDNGELRARLFTNGVAQLECAVKTVTPFNIPPSAYASLFESPLNATQGQTRFDAVSSDTLAFLQLERENRSEFQKLSGNLRDKLSLLDSGLAPLMQATIAEVEELSAVVASKRKRLNETDAGDEEIESAVAAVNAARELLTQTDAYAVRLQQAQARFQDFLDMLNDAITEQSTELRPTARDLANEFVSIVSGIQAQKSKDAEKITSDGVEAAANNAGSADATSGGLTAEFRSALTNALASDLEALARATAFLQSITQTARPIVETHIGSINFDDNPVEVNGFVFGRCTLPTTVDFFTVNGKARTTLPPGGDVTFTAQVGQNAEPTIAAVGENAGLVTIGDRSVVSEGARRFGFKVTVKDDAEAGKEINLEFKSSGVATTVERTIVVATADPPADTTGNDAGVSAAATSGVVTYDGNSSVILGVQDFLNAQSAAIGRRAIGLSRDGKMGAQTREAIRRYQRLKAGVPANGALTEATLEAIGQEIADTPILLNFGVGNERLEASEIKALENALALKYRAVACDCIKGDDAISEMERRFLLDWRVEYAIDNRSETRFSFFGPMDSRIVSALLNSRSGG